MTFKTAFALTLALTLPVLAAKDKERTWKTGRVLDSQSAKTFVQTGSSTQSSASTTGIATATTTGTAAGNSYSGLTTASGTSSTSGTSATQIHTMAIQDTQLLIVTDEFLYVVNDRVEKGVGLGLHGGLARAIANRNHGCHVIINDPVQYSQEKATLFLKDVDGKECKLEIVRQERRTQSNP
jgi:hypothetical protein